MTFLAPGFAKFITGGREFDLGDVVIAKATSKFILHWIAGRCGTMSPLTRSIDLNQPLLSDGNYSPWGGESD